MIISDNGIALIKRHEGLRFEAYKCPAGVWTIGYGHTHQVKKNDVINELVATEFLKQDVRHAQSAIKKYVKTILTQHQFDALVSFIFNVGVGNFKKSTLLKMLNNNRIESAVLQFSRWNKARVNGILKPLRGLTRRRNEEAELFANLEASDHVQQVNAPAQKTVLNSKTNAVSVIGVGGLVGSQLDNGKLLLDQFSNIRNKGGDIIDGLGGVFGNISWPILISMALIGIFIYVMVERKRKIDHYGL